MVVFSTVVAEIAPLVVALLPDTMTTAHPPLSETVSTAAIGECYYNTSSMSSGHHNKSYWDATDEINFVEPFNHERYTNWEAIQTKKSRLSPGDDVPHEYSVGADDSSPLQQEMTIIERKGRFLENRLRVFHPNVCVIWSKSNETEKTSLKVNEFLKVTSSDWKTMSEVHEWLEKFMMEEMMMTTNYLNDNDNKNEQFTTTTQLTTMQLTTMQQLSATEATEIKMLEIVPEFLELDKKNYAFVNEESTLKVCDIDDLSFNVCSELKEEYFNVHETTKNVDENFYKMNKKIIFENKTKNSVGDDEENLGNSWHSNNDPGDDKRRRKGLLFCEICGYETKRNEWLKIHMKNVHNLKKTKTCKNKKIKKKKKSKKISRIETNKILKFVSKKVSEICTKTIHGQETMKLERNSEELEKMDSKEVLKRGRGRGRPRKISDVVVVGKDGKKEKMTNAVHRKSNNNNNSDQHLFYACDTCDYMSDKSRNMLLHKARMHGERTFRCQVCDKAFATRKDLNQHSRFHEMNFCCELCGKTLRSKCGLLIHINAIHDKKQTKPLKSYLCNICGRMLRSKTDYTVHCNKEHFGVHPHVCKICGMRFHAKANLRCHQTTHCDTRDFVCQQCGKTFRQRQGLRIHMNIHKEERPYKCSICDKSFTQRGALVRHDLTHTTQRPFDCKLCSASFNDSSILRRHMIGIHKIEDQALLRHNVKEACHKARHAQVSQRQLIMRGRPCKKETTTGFEMAKTLIELSRQERHETDVNEMKTSSMSILSTLDLKSSLDDVLTLNDVKQDFDYENKQILPSTSSLICFAADGNAAAVVNGNASLTTTMLSSDLYSIYFAPISTINDISRKCSSNQSITK